MEKQSQRVMITEPQSIDLGNGIYGILTPPVGFHEYLVLGEEKVLLIDTGMGVGSLRKLIDTLTDLPVILVNTHCHPDHAGGNAEFDPAFINPADMDVFEKMTTLEFRSQDVSHMPGGAEFVTQLQPQGPTPIALKDGQEIDLGNRTVRIIFTPGHTRGSLCIYDNRTGSLFGGDTLIGRGTALKEWNSATVEDLYDSLMKLKEYKITAIYSGHDPKGMSPDLLDRKIACARQLLDGAKGERMERMGSVTYLYEAEGTAIEYIPEKLRR